ncbi:hypothetical protein [Streptomyces sp. NPDC102462]|uniref:hypothetical protein n=1 Tax=Streptomyces sp. NPDC102462 TaxID=3366178 RepID=UPI00382AC543
MTTTQLPSTEHQIGRRHRCALRLIGRSLLVLLGVLIAPVAATAAVWATATVTADLALLAAAAIAALVMSCAPLVYAGVRRPAVTALTTTAVLVATSAAAYVTVLQPLGETPPQPRSRPTGHWSLPTGSRLAYTLLRAHGTHARPR